MLELPVQDRFSRPLRNLRISVTDRCNLRCTYCMPQEEYAWLPRADILSYEELVRLAEAFVSLGVDRIRLTGGEPTLRRGLPTLVSGLAALPGLTDLAMTTNALRLQRLATPLREAGLGRLTVSLDTLQQERYSKMTRRDGLADALEGIAAAAEAGFGPIKINTVVVRGRNDDEVMDPLRYAREGGHELRLIEYMDVGGATEWDPALVVDHTEILERISAEHGPARALAERGAAPAQRYELSDGTVFGLITSTTAPFCGSCDRARLTADGRLFTCLYGRDGLDLRTPLRGGASTDQLRAHIAGTWAEREDRGAEERLQLTRRSPLADAVELREDPHLEMHKRGG